MRKASMMKLARVARGMSQAELGKKIGKTQVTVSEYERGYRSSITDKRKPPLEVAKQICKVLKTTLADLFPELRVDGRPSVKGRKQQTRN